MTTADKAFEIIAVQKKLLSRDQLRELNRERSANGVEEQGPPSLENFVRQRAALAPDDLEQVLKSRARHGRACRDCGNLTFLLPGQRSGDTPCEFCGGPLQPGRVDAPETRVTRGYDVDRVRGGRSIPNPPENKKLRKQYIVLLQRCETEADPDLFVRTAGLAIELTRFDDAKALLTKALEIKPGHSFARRKLQDLSSGALAAKAKAQRAQEERAEDQTSPAKPVPRARLKPKPEGEEAAPPPAPAEPPPFDPAAATLDFTEEEGALAPPKKEDETWDGSEAIPTSEEEWMAREAADLAPDELAAAATMADPEEAAEGTFETIGFGEILDAVSAETQPPPDAPSRAAKKVSEEIAFADEAFGEADAAGEEAPLYQEPVYAPVPSDAQYHAPPPMPDASKDEAKPSRRAQMFQEMMMAPPEPVGGPVSEAPASEPAKEAQAAPRLAPAPSASPEHDPRFSPPALDKPRFAPRRGHPRYGVPDAGPKEIGPFRLNLVGSLTRPFSNMGLSVIILGAIFMGFCTALGQLSFLLGTFLVVFPMLYISAYFSRVVTFAARGEPQLPSWPELNDAFSSGFRVALVGFNCAILAFSPYFLLGFISAVSGSDSYDPAAENAAIKRSLVGKDLSRCGFYTADDERVELGGFAGEPLALMISGDFGYRELAEDRGFLLLRRFADAVPGPKYLYAVIDPEEETSAEAGPRLLFIRGFTLPGELGRLDGGDLPVLVMVNSDGRIGDLLVGDELRVTGDEAVQERLRALAAGRMRGSGGSFLSGLGALAIAIGFLFLFFFVMTFLVIYYPMALMTTVLTGDWAMSFRVPRVLACMAATKKDYFAKILPFWGLLLFSTFLILTFGMIFVGLVFGALANSLVGFLLYFIMVHMVFWVTLIYGLIACGDVLGRYFYHNQNRLPLFS